MKKINLKSTTVEITEEGIMHIHIKDNADMDLDDAIKTLDAMGELGNGKKFPVLIDSGTFINIDKDVKIFSASKIGNIYTLADAIACDSLAQKIIATFYKTTNNPAVPTKIFDDKTEAIQWLKSFIKVKSL